MNLGLAVGTFAVVLPAELPDKTFISAIVLASKHRPFPVWVGTAAGLVVQAAVGVLAGRLLALLPHRAVEGVVAGLFLAGAAYLLFVPERSAEQAGVEAARRGEEADAALAGAGDGSSAGAGRTPSGTAGVERPPERSSARIALMTFGIVTLAEFGDLTQVIVANLTARYRDPWSVFAGAAVAFVLVSAVGVAAGRTLTRHVPLALVRRISGAALGGLGIWSLVSVLRG